MAVMNMPEARQRLRGRLALALAAIFACGASAAASYDVTEARFGADGSDGKDDSSAIQAALNMARGSSATVEVRVPAGTYVVSQQLGVYSNTKIVLEPGATIRRPPGSASKVMLVGRHLGGNGSDCPRDESCRHAGHAQLRNVEICGGAWDAGMDDASVTGAFALLHGENIKVSGVTFRHFTEHILNFSASRDVVVENAVFEDALRFAGTSSDFWAYYDVGDTNRFLSIEAIHLDVANAEGEATTFPLDDTPCENVVVRNCEFRDVFAGVGNHHVIAGVRQDGFRVENCSFTGLVSYAVHAHGFTNCTILANRASGCAGMAWGRECSAEAVSNTVASSSRHAFFFTGGSSVIAGNAVAGASLHGANLEGCRASVTSNAFDRCGQCGVRTDWGSDVAVAGNRIAAAGENGIGATGGSGLSVRENSLVSCAGAGILVDGAAGAEIAGNTVSNCVTCGVLAKSCDDPSLAGNVVFGNGSGPGFSISNCRALTAEGNRAIGCGVSGFAVSGGSAELLRNYVADAATNGVSVVGGAIVVATSNTVVNAGGAGFYLHGCNGGAYGGNVARNCRQGFDLASTRGVELVRNTVSESTGHGVVARNCLALSVAENAVEQARGRGLTFAGGDVSAVGNRVSAPGEFGLCAEGGAAVTAVSNVLSDAGTSGIRLISVADAYLADNRIESASAHGVCVTDAAGVVALSGNEVSGCKSAGVFISGSRADLLSNRIADAGTFGVQLIEAEASSSANVVSNAADAAFGFKDCLAGGRHSGNEITGCKYGFNATDCDGLEIANNSIARTVSHGIVLSGCEVATVEGNDVLSAGGRGITVSGGDVLIARNRIAAPAAFGIYAAGAADAEIVGNVVDGPQNSGLRLAGLSDACVAENVVSNAVGSGVHVSDSAGLVVERNAVVSASGSGMTFSGSSGCRLAFNYVSDTGAEGLFYQQSSDGSILSNEVVRAGGMAIRVEGDGASANVSGNQASSTSDHDIRIGPGATGCTVVGNECGSGGVGIDATAMEGTRYTPADCRVQAIRSVGGPVVVSWSPLKIANGTGRYVVERVPESAPGGDDAFAQCFSTQVDDLDQTSLLLDNDVSECKLFRVRAVNTIAGVDYVSPGDPAYVAKLECVRFLLDGDGEDSEVLAEIGKPMPEIVPPVREGMVFDGYWTGRNRTGSQVYGADGSSVSDCTVALSPTRLYAAWSDVPDVEVVFDAAGGWPTPGAAILPVGSLLSLYLPTDPRREGYDFAGWQTASGKVVTNEFVVPASAEPLHLRAMWNVRTYEVEFSANGGKGGSLGELEYGAPIVAPEVTRTGYEFLGWSPSVPETMPAADMSFGAQWRINQYRVAFDANGGVEDTVLTLDFGSKISPPAVSRAGYSFDGWMPAVAATVPASNTTYVAQWTKIDAPVNPVDPDPDPDPDPETPTNPDPETPTNPDPETPTDPEPGTPTDPEPGTPTDPEPGTPTDPEPGTPTDPEPGPEPGPGTPTEPQPEPEVRHVLYDEFTPIANPASAFQAATVWDGWLERDGEVIGTFQAKVAKFNTRGAMKVTVSVTETGKKKVAGNGLLVFGTDGAVTASCTLRDKRSVQLEFGQHELCGVMGDVEIRGARNVFSSKRPEDKQESGAILAKLMRTAVVYWNGNALSVVVANKGKCRVSGNLASGARVTAATQLIAGEEWCAAPISYAKASAQARLLLWMNRVTGEIAVEGLEKGAKVQWATVPKETLRFFVNEDFEIPGATVLTQFLPPDEGLEFTGGTKWKLPKGGTVKLDRASGEFVDTKPANGNPSGLKLTYTKKTGAFKGSFKVHAVVNGKLKKYSATVAGIMVGDVGYGTATIKKLASVEIEVR